MNNVVPLAADNWRTVLDDLAHRARIGLQKSEDHQVSVAVVLADAKAICKDHGVPFKTWLAKELPTRGYNEANKLALIGASSNPAKALEDHRERARRRKEKQRAKGADAGDSVTSRYSASRAAQSEQAARAIIQLSSLSEPAYLVEHMAASDAAPRVDEAVANALEWLTEFAVQWTAQRKEHHDA